MQWERPNGPFGGFIGYKNSMKFGLSAELGAVNC